MEEIKDKTAKAFRSGFVTAVVICCVIAIMFWLMLLFKAHLNTF